MAKADSPYPDPHFDYEHGVLKNIPGFTDQKNLDDFERIQATKAILNLKGHPVRGTFDTAHLKAIHKLTFSGIYCWADEFRQVNLHRSGSYYFVVVQLMKENLKTTLAKLATDAHLKGLDAEAFASRAAYYFGELDSIHPFREGNRRTQREFIRQLAAEAGHRINWSRVTREQMVGASIESHSHGRNTALAALILSAVELAHLP
jgi:cell filamentation protein